MSKVRCYIKPFDEHGVYRDWVDVSGDIDIKSIGSFKSSLDGSDFDIGVFTFSSISLKINNTSGQYSDSNDSRSMFRYRRGGSKVKITWQKGDNDSICNFSICGNVYPYYELNVLEGLLNDDSLTTDLKTNFNTFKVLSYASIFDTIETPYSSLVNGQTVKQILDILLFDTVITETMSVVGANIDPNNNVVVNDVSGFEDTNIKDVIDEMLLISNSVLYLNGDTLYVNSREESADLKQTFYGQASLIGLENIQKLDRIRSGLNRTFNLWRWEETSLSARNQTEIDGRGLRDKSIKIDSITNNTTRQSILNNYVTEFNTPKREFEFTTILDVENRLVLDKVNFDYPTPYYSAEEEAIPRYARSVYGDSKYPFGQFGLTLTLTDFFKIISINIDLKKDLITYKVREL